MSENIVDFTGSTLIPTPPDKVLDKAKEQLKKVVVIGVTMDGEFYFASSHSDGGDVIWLLEVAKTRILRAGGV